MPITAELFDGTRLEFPEGTEQSVIEKTVKDQTEAIHDAQVKPDTGFTGAAKSSYEKMKGEGALVLGKLGLMDTQGAEDYYNKQKSKADKIFTPTEKGWDEAPFEKFRELLGSSVPYMALPLGAAGAVYAAPEAIAGLGIGAIGAPAIAGFAANVGQFTGTNLGRQLDEGSSLNDASLGSAAAAAIPQSILDIASDHMIPGVKNIFGRAGIKLGDKEAAAVAKQQLANSIPKGKIATAIEYGGKAAQTAAIEGLNEAGQQVFERLQAGLDLTDPQARQEYFDNFIGGAVLGGAISVPGHYYDKNVEQPRQAKLLALQQQAEERKKQEEQKAAEQTQLQETYQNLNVPQTTNLLPAPEKAAPIPEKNMAPAIQQDMLQNYNGMFDQQAIDNVFGKGAFDQINEKREMEHGKPRLNQMSIEDLAHAGANPEDLSRLLTVQHDYTNVKEKNFAPAQILKMAEKKGIETGTGGFNSFLMRTTGTDNLQDMTYAQRHAVAKALNSVPVNEGAKTILPEGHSNATPWHPADYDDAVKAVQADLAQNKELSQADVMKTIHGSTFLGQGNAPRAEDAKLMLDEMVRRGDVSLNVRPDKSSTPDNPKFLQTVIPAHPMANTPAGMDVRREVLGEGRGRREVFSLYEDGQRMGSFSTKQEAEEHGMSRLHDDILKQTITAAPHQLLPNGEIHPLARRYAEMAKNELNERQGISRDFRGITTSQGLEGANERLAKLGIFNEKVQELAPEIKKDLENRLRKYGLASVAVRMMDSIANGAANAAYHAGLIKMAVDAEDPMGELDHESIHALIDLGAFRPDELRVLENKAKSEWLQKYIKDTGKYDLYKKQYESEGRDMKTFESDMLEESVAEAFKHFNKQQPPAGMVGNLFKRISKFFEAVRNAFTGAGFKTADDIFGGVTRGEFKPTKETTGQVKYSAAEQPRKIGEKIVGAPPNLSTEKDRTELVNRMTNLLEHPYAMYDKSKDWYERSGDTIKEISHGDKALMEKVIRLTALYSQANSLGGNITAVIRSMAQLARGDQKILAGRFPETTAKRIPAILAAKTMDTSVAGVDDKLMNFYRNLHDGAFKTDTFKDSSTIDRWMMRLFGYPHSEDQEKGGATGVSSTQYKYAKDLIQRIADENEKRTGEKLKPRQIQAALWTYVKNQSEAEKAKAEGKSFTPSSLDFSDYVKRATANITWESRPSTSIDLLPGIHNAPRQAQEAFNRAVRSIFETADGKNKIFDLLGEGVLHSSQMSLGAYENQTAPNVITKVVLDKDNKGHMVDVANKAAAIIGYVTKQDAVPWYRADPTASGKNASVGYKVTPNVDVNPEFEEALFKHLNKEIPGIGFTRIDNGFDFINFRDENGKPFGMLDNEFLNKLKSALKSFDPNVNFGIDKFRAESAYIYNDWKEDKDGQGYLQRFSSKELANIQSTISNWRQNYDSIAKQFEKEYGWDKPTETPTEKYSLKAPNTEEFKQWFKGSKIVNEDGSPKVMYHGTARDITEFQPKQANAIFLTDDPKFASDFSSMSEDYVAYDTFKSLPFETQEKIIKDATNLAVANGILNKGDVRFARQTALTGGDINKYGINWHLKKFMKPYLETGKNIIPVFAKAKNPFDYDRYDIDGLDAILNKDSNLEELGQVTLLEISKGNWKTIESSKVQERLRALGFDGFYVNENEHKNLAVYNPNQIKSVFNQKPTESSDIRYALTNAPPKRLTSLEKQETAGERLNSTIRDVKEATQNQDFWTGLRNNWVDKGSGLTRTLQNQEVYKDGVLRADLLSRAYAQVINLVKNGLQSGIPIINNDGSIIIKTDAVNNLANSHLIADKLDENAYVKASGLSGRGFVAEVARAMRGKEILEEDARLGLKRELQVTPEQIAWAEQQIKNVPELNQIFSIWKNVNTGLVNLWEQAGLLDKTEADSYRAKKHYVSLAASKADLEEMINSQYSGNAPGLKSTKKIFKLEGSELDRNIWENVDKQYAAMLTAAYQNHIRKTAVDQLRSIGMATTTRINQKGNEVPLYQGDPNINLRYKENGKIVNAIVHNQTDLAAFEAMHYELNPIMKFMAGSTKLLRAGALLNPMFWIRQLIKDPIHANLVANSGIVTPFHSAGEFMRILMKDSAEAKLLAERGVIGQYDSTIDIYDYLNQVGKEKSKPSTLDKALHKMMQVHEASDAATRVAIFKKEKANGLAKGMSEADATNFAVMKARESINFALHGNSKTLFYARHMVPFLSASITSLDTVYRAATGYGLPPAEKAAAQKLFKQRAFIMAAMCFAYAMLMQNDDDYKKLPDYVKDNNWLIKNPTGDGFIKVPTPFEVGFLFKTIPEAAVRYMYGTSTGKEVLHSYWEGVTNNLPGNALPIPQLFKPALETVTNHSFYTGNTIESLGDARLPVEDRGRNASEISKKLSKSGLSSLGLSPAKIDNLIQGYMAELGTFTTSMADKAVYAAEGKTPPATNLAKDPFFKSFLTDPNADKAVNDFYQLEQNANQVAQEFTQLKAQGKAEEIQSFVKDKEKMQQIGAAPALRRIGQSMTAIKKQINFVHENQSMSPEQRRDEINRLTAQYNRVAEQGVKLASSLGLPR